MTSTATEYNSPAHIHNRETFLTTIAAAVAAGDIDTIAAIADGLVWATPHASALFGVSEGLIEHDVVFKGTIRLR